MCGFYFNISLPLEFDHNSNIEKFNKLKHRGVDNSSYIEIDTDKKIFMGHHRLSINDLSNRSNQPFHTDCKKFYILFNGEIFNFKELKKNIDYDFKTFSDTEVIIAGYKKFGRDFLKKIEGFFSIAILDLSKNILICTVDPTSVKSLYYELKNNSISLASELSSFIPKTEILNTLSHEALQIYLQYGFIHAPFSIIKDTFKVEPGELIEFDLSTNNKTNFKKFNKHNYQNKKKVFDELVLNAHQSRLISDVPIATMLSGGVDSTMSNLIYSKFKNRKEKVFTLGIEDSYLDESRIALEQTNILKLKHKIININNRDIIDEFKQVSNYLDEPFADSSSILVSLLSKEISKEYKVVISSDGGDELLYGYSRHRFFFLFSWICFLPKFIKNILKKILLSPLLIKILEKLKIYHSEIKINKILSMLDHSDSTKAYLSLIKILPDSTTSKILKSYSYDNLMNSIESKYGYKTIKEIDYNLYLPSINFKNDRCGMQHSLEIREPLLNFDLVRNQFNNKIKLLDLFSPKRQFRNFLNLHKIFVRKEKHGFSFSQKEILEFNNFEILCELEKNFEIISNFFNISFIQKMISDFKTKNKWTTELWTIACFTFWLKNKTT